VDLIWHYTNGLKIDEILKSGYIDLARSGVPNNERAAAWFSTNPIWDASANRGNLKVTKKGMKPGRNTIHTLDDIEETPFDPAVMERDFLGRFRIGVLPEAAPHGWETFKKLSGMDKDMARTFESVTMLAKYGDPKHWRASFVAVPRKFWRTVEKLTAPDRITWSAAGIGKSVVGEGVWTTHEDLGYETVARA
jgi:hypothetical protein